MLVQIKCQAEQDMLAYSIHRDFGASLCGRPVDCCRSWLGEVSLAFKLVSLAIIGIYGPPMERLAEHPVIIAYARQGWWVAYFLVAMLTTCGMAYFGKVSKVDFSAKIFSGLWKNM